MVWMFAIDAGNGESNCVEGDFNGAASRPANEVERLYWYAQWREEGVTRSKELGSLLNDDPRPSRVQFSPTFFNR